MVISVHFNGEGDITQLIDKELKDSSGKVVGVCTSAIPKGDGYETTIKLKEEFISSELHDMLVNGSSKLMSTGFLNL